MTPHTLYCTVLTSRDLGCKSETHAKRTPRRKKGAQRHGGTSQSKLACGMEHLGDPSAMRQADGHRTVAMLLARATLRAVGPRDGGRGPAAREGAEPSRGVTAAEPGRDVTAAAPGREAADVGRGAAADPGRSALEDGGAGAAVEGNANAE